MLETQQSSGAPPTTDPSLKQKKKLLNGPHFVFTYPNGSVYEGAFRDGKLHGFGVYKYMPSGDLYEGEWKADMKHGQGRYCFAGGDSYIGSWYMGKKHGKGKFAFASGDEYYGNWKADVMDGYGVFRLERNGDQYEGFWEHGLREGLGVLRLGNGNIYDGEWSGGKENGVGVLQTVDGAMYCGFWKAGMKDGKGVEQDKGMTFLTEYLGGYLISKEPYSAHNSCNDEEMSALLQRMQSWAAPPALTLQPSGVPEQLNAEAVDALKRTLDTWRSAYLTLFDDVCAQRQKKEIGEQPSSQTASVAPDQAVVQEAKRYSDVLKSRVQLLEAALGERMLDSRRAQDNIREKDATIQDLKFHLLRFRNSRRKSAVSRDLFASHNTTADSDEVTTQGDSGAGDGDTGAIAAIAELKKQNLSLFQTNYAQQQKLTVLASENTKLATEVAALEDNIKEMEELLTSLLMSAHGMNADDSHDADENGVDVSRSATQEMPEPELRRRLREANQSNAELLVRQSGAEKDLDAARAEVSALRKQLKDNASARAEAIDKAVAAATAAATATKGANDTVAYTAAPLPDWRTDAEHDAAKTEIMVNGSLLDKEKLIAKLRQENAELSRLVEEYRFQLDEADHAENETVAGAEKKKRHKKNRSSSPSGEKRATRVDNEHPEELEKVEGDLKKAKRKLKKMVEERNELALDLYNTQCNLARVTRVPYFFRGHLVVSVALQEPSPANVNTKAIVHVKDADPTQIEVEGVARAFRFDVCFPSAISTDHLFLEVKPALVFAAQGFQVGYVGLGACRPGSRNVMGDLLPFLVEALRSECTVHAQHKAKYRVAYRVGAAEMDAKGVHDCFSGKQLSCVVKDSRGYVGPEGLTFVDCGGERIADLLRQAFERHANSEVLSHLWMQIQVTVTHPTEQTACCGRLTILDLAGLTPDDEFDSFDAASIRYVKRSLRQVNDLLASMQTDTNSVPYGSSAECSLLYDLLGGNSMTTVIGSVPTCDTEQRGQILAGLTTLESIGKLRNGPYLQDFVSSDELRWREIVSAISSAEQALPKHVPVEDTAF